MDPLLLSIKVYTETFYAEVPYERAYGMLLTEDMAININELSKAVDYFEVGFNEDVLIQFLGILLNAQEKDLFNEYFVKYLEHWSSSERMSVMQSYYHEVNSEYEEAEKSIRSIIDRAPSAISYNVLLAFYRRTGKVDRIGETFEEILKNNSEVVNQDPDSFYFARWLLVMVRRVRVNLEFAFAGGRFSVAAAIFASVECTACMLRRWHCTSWVR